MRMRMEMKMKMAKNDKQNIRRSQKGRNKAKAETEERKGVKRTEAAGGREGNSLFHNSTVISFHTHTQKGKPTGGGTLELSWPICHLCDLAVLIVFRNAFQVLPFERKCVKLKAKKAKNLPKELSINSTGVAQFNCT